MKSRKAFKKFTNARCGRWLLALLLISSSPLAFGQYVLSIDGNDVDVTVGEKQTVTLTNGETVTLLLKKKAILTYDSHFFSFQYKSEFSPSKSDLGSGINQMLMATAQGTVVMAQEYTSLDPSSLVDTMIQAMTKDEVNAGYTLDETPIEKKLADGKVLKGKIATTTHKDDQWIRTVVAYGDGDEGVLFVTQISKSNISAEQPVLDMFWNTLALKGF